MLDVSKLSLLDRFVNKVCNKAEGQTYHCDYIKKVGDLFSIVFATLESVVIELKTRLVLLYLSLIVISLISTEVILVNCAVNCDLGTLTEIVKLVLLFFASFV